MAKGKDERMVGYIKHHFFVRYRAFDSLAHLNQLAEQWLREEADQRVHGTVRERVADRSTAANSVAVLLAASGQATSLEGIPEVLADGGVENVNAQVDALVQAGIVRRLLALTECAFSNSLIEAWWRSLKHQWLFLHPLDSVATVRRLVAFYVDEHNRVIPHAAVRGRTPDEMYFGAEGAEAAQLPSRMAAARAARLAANRAASCPVCPALEAAG